MTFTDDDLKRLKEDMECKCDHPEGCLHKVWGPPEILALLARLEAAEKALEFAQEDDDWTYMKAWRKAAGKE